MINRRGVLGRGSNAVVRRNEVVILLAGSQSLAKALICRCRTWERSLSNEGRTTLLIALRTRDIFCLVKWRAWYADGVANGNAIVAL